MTLGFNGLMELAKKEAKNQFGEDFNVEDTGNWYKLIAPFIMLSSILEDEFLSLKASRNIYTAHGDELDDLFSNDLVFRLQGSKACGEAIVSGANGIIIEKQSIRVKGNNDIVYTNIEEGTIVDGQIELKFEAEDIGEVGNMRRGNFISVIKAPAGIKNITNKEISSGTNTETDYEYLERYLSTVRDITWTLESIKSEIKKIQGVISCDGVRNNTIEDLFIPKKSIRLIVDGGDENIIAETIYKKIHTADTVGNVKVDIEIAPKIFQEIKFDRPIIKKIDYKYSIISNEKEKILELLKEYLNETKIGSFISTEEFRKNKLDGVTLVGLKELTLQFKLDNSFSSYVQLNYDEKGQAGEGVAL